MKFPIITDYIEAINNMETRLRTLSGVTPIYDNQGEPLYCAARQSVKFMVRSADRLLSLRCFTSERALQRYCECLSVGIGHGEIKEYELYVFCEGEIGDYFTIIVSEVEQISSTEIKACDEVEFVEGRLPFERDGLWGFVDRSGSVIVEPCYSRVEEFCESRAVVELDGQQGLIDRDGGVILPVEFDEVSWDGSLFAYCDSKGLKGCYDRIGREIVPCKYEWIGEFSANRALVMRNKRHGFVDLSGNEVIPLVYESATSFDSNGLARVVLCGRRLVIDVDGKEI